MANACVSTLRVTGEGREAIKKLFDRAAVPTNYGCAWDIPGFGTVIVCDKAHGDGITVEQDAVVIRGESKWEPPLLLIKGLSEQFPTLEFYITGFEVQNCFFQRWVFQAGIGYLIDCMQQAYEGEGDRIVYMQAGKQLAKFPDWIAASEHPSFRDGVESEHEEKNDDCVPEPKDTYEA